MEITINYSDMKFYDENYEKLIHTVLTKGAELQKVPEEAEISVLICDADTIHELNRSEGITIVLITHFMEEAVTADHVLVVDRTKLQMQGTAREVFSQADKLTAMGLDVPVAADLAHGLRKKGYEIPEDCMTDEELGEALCPYASNI